MTAKRAWTVNATMDATIFADEERIGSSLDALIENAVKFTAEGSRISIAAQAEGDIAVIEVSDSGVGIPADQLERIFDRFARADGVVAQGPEGRGTGLGLAIVKAIVEAHGGSVGVESELGQGSAFRIYLPRFEPVAAVELREVRAPALAGV